MEAWRYANNREVLTDFGVAVELVKAHPFLLGEFNSNQLSSYKELAMVAVGRDGSSFQYVEDASLKADPELVLCAVRRWAGALEFADSSLLVDREFALAAVAVNGNCLEHLDESLQSDKQVVCTAVEQDGFALRHCDHDNGMKADPDVLLKAVSQNGLALKFVPENVFLPQVIIAAVKQNPRAVEYIHDSWSNHSEHPEIKLLLKQ